MVKSRMTEALNIKYPIIQGGMAWIAEANLAAAVSNAGGLGLIAGGSAPADVVRKEVLKAKELTDKPFGINIMLMADNAADLAQMVIEEKVPVVTTGAGNPGKYIPAWKEAGIKVIPVIASVAMAKRVERVGADMVVAEGNEAGGHIGEQSTMALLPQVVDAVKIPVLAAGGIADGRGLAAVFMLGAQGVQIGTRFLCAKECAIHENYKNLVIKAKDTDSAVTGRLTGAPVRQIKNRYTKKIQSAEKDFVDLEQFEHMTVGSLRKAVQDGNLEEGSFMAGQVAGMVKKIQPAKEIIEEIFTEAENIIKNFQNSGGVQFV